MGFDLRGLAKALLLAALLLTGAAVAATVQYVYDDLGRLVAAIDASGQTTVYTYDAAGNLLSVSNTASSQLVVVSFTPNHGKAGDTVAIFGSAFIPDPAQNTVSFNGTPAAVSAATATSIVAVVPSGATTGPISVSNVNGTATSAASFVIVAPPTITGVFPGVVARGVTTRVEISGTELAYATAVTFSQAGITSLILPGATGQSLPINLNVAASVPSGSYTFSVTNAAGTGSGSVAVSVVTDLSNPARPVSVFMPAPAQIAPSGSVMSVSQPASVFLPGPEQIAPSGSSMSVTRPVSVLMP